MPFDRLRVGKVKLDPDRYLLHVDNVERLLYGNNQDKLKLLVLAGPNPPTT